MKEQLRIPKTLLVQIAQPYGNEKIRCGHHSNAQWTDEAFAAASGWFWDASEECHICPDCAKDLLDNNEAIILCDCCEKELTK